MDALAVSYAAELARRGIESSIVVPGAYRSRRFAEAEGLSNSRRYADQHSAGSIRPRRQGEIRGAVIAIEGEMQRRGTAFMQGQHALGEAVRGDARQSEIGQLDLVSGLEVL